MKDYTQLGGLTLAYIGDAIYEVYIRDYLIKEGKTKPNTLHRLATHYVSAKAQAFLILEMLDAKLLTEEEIQFYKRGRNAKSHTFAKNADVTTYRIATGFEALMGYLHLTNQTERMAELINWCIDKVGNRNEK
ncbi:Mini-ribonuclease 3 [Melissococcus plutonius]|uniref:Mini-ribonuclease 3 n=2 Tax=Melissococcus plutonius TaxID=33970 RepID=F3Y7Q9_MELPT|nr:Mini-ribonuclease 3 [Melissococcus plutonius]BAL61341.1 ribonuclease III family protein [Melissococcus plutonius DAT561]AIM24338.1 mini-ribonuclease 3 [Melissococcus plutonius S1]KMT25696.1 mini-ribonuclease 3 [Melissococcus plutonius]KMT27041.1 mini-ribonuclease 3 [Melissococcus plutonius]KMT28417.1 mini-ribonuclease 3 [Melissococcus plutonius]